MSEILNSLKNRDAKPMSQLEQDLFLLSDRYRTLKLENDKNKAEKIELENHLQTLQKGDITSGESDVNTLNAQLVKLFREVDKLKSEKEKLEQKIKDKTERKLKTQKSINKRSNEITNLESDITTLDQKRIEYDQKLKRILSEIDNTNKDTERLKQNMIEIEEGITKYRNEARKTKAYIDETKAKIPHRPLSKLLLKKDAHSSSIPAICFGPNYKSFITVGDDKFLKQWSLPSLSVSLNIGTHSIVNNIRYNPDSQFLSLSCQDKYIRILDLSNGRFCCELSNHTDQCTDVAWISKNQLLSSSKDRTVKLYDISKKAVLSTINAISAVYSICPAEELYAAGCMDGSIRIIDTRAKRVVNTISRLHSKAVVSIEHKGNLLYSLGLDGVVCETNIKTLTKVREWKDPKLEVKNLMAKMSLSLDGVYLAVPSTKGVCVMFDTTKQVQPIYLDHNGKEVISTAFAGNMLATGTSEKELFLWTQSM